MPSSYTLFVHHPCMDGAIYGIQYSITSYYLFLWRNYTEHHFSISKGFKLSNLILNSQNTPVIKAINKSMLMDFLLLKYTGSEVKKKRYQKRFHTMWNDHHYSWILNKKKRNEKQWNISMNRDWRMKVDEINYTLSGNFDISFTNFETCLHQ